MSKVITLEDFDYNGFCHIKKLELTDVGNLFISNYYNEDGEISMDMVILNSKEIERLKDLLNKEIK